MQSKTASNELWRRYASIALFMLVLGAAGVALELTLRALGSPYLLTQRKGPGQVALYGLSIIALVWFAYRVAGINPIRYALGYIRDWRHVLSGFIAAWAFATIIMLVIHAAMIWTGAAAISWDAVHNFSFTTLASLLAAIGAMLVLVIAEELIFRAFLIRHFRPVATAGVTVLALIVAALIFSALHIVSLGGRLGDDDLWQLLFGLFLLGMLLGTVYVCTGSLGCSMGIHAGVLGFKVFLRKTELVVYQGSNAMGGDDLRTGPLVWLVIVVIALLFVVARRWLHARFAVETAVGQPESIDPTLGFFAARKH